MVFTLGQFILLAIVLVAGFCLGVASRPGTRRWKNRVREQSASFTAYHDDAEDRIRAAQARATALEAEAAALRADREDAARTIETPRAARAQGSGAAVSPREPLAVPAATLEPVEPPPMGPAEPAMPARGWFGGNTRDDLTRLRGIDGPLDTRLFALGVLRFEDLEKLSAEDEMALEERLALPVGYIAREQWRIQAALLRAGKDAEHAERFGATSAEA